MEILVIGRDDSGGARPFEEFASAAGHRVRRIAPGTSMPVSTDAWLGVICFDDSDPAALHDDVRHLSIPIVLAGPGATPADLLAEMKARCEALPVPAPMRDQLVGPLTTALSQTLTEMAGVDVFVRSAYQRATPTVLGDVSALIALQSTAPGALILDFSTAAATALTRRILAGTKQELSADVVQDCVCEVANVVAGQAKALLAGTPYHYTFAPPIAAAPEALRTGAFRSSLVIACGSDVGNLALQFCQHCHAAV